MIKFIEMQRNFVINKSKVRNFFSILVCFIKKNILFLNDLNVQSVKVFSYLVYICVKLILYFKYLNVEVFLYIRGINHRKVNIFQYQNILVRFTQKYISYLYYRNIYIEVWWKCILFAKNGRWRHETGDQTGQHCGLRHRA